MKDHKKLQSQALFVVFLRRIRKCSINNNIYCQKRKTLYHIVWKLFSLFFLCSVHNFATQKWLIYVHSIRTLSWSIKWKLFIQPVLLCKLYEVKVFFITKQKVPFCFVDFVIYKENKWKRLRFYNVVYHFYSRNMFHLIIVKILCKFL